MADRKKMKTRALLSAAAWSAMALAVTGMVTPEIAAAADRTGQSENRSRDRDRPDFRNRSNGSARVQAPSRENWSRGDNRQAQSRTPDMTQSRRQAIRTGQEQREERQKVERQRDQQRDVRQDRQNDRRVYGSDRRNDRTERREERRDNRYERRDDRTNNRYDRRDDRRNDRSDRRDDRRDYRNDRNNRQDWRYNNRDQRRDYRDTRRWNRQDWRRDNRYNWRDYRARHRSTYRIGRYYAPYYGYSYRRLGIGFTLGSMFYGNRYWINDPWAYRLPEVYGPYRWVRYYDDVLLVNVYSGEVVDVIYDFFW